MMILLPEKIVLLRARPRQSIVVDQECFALYFDNFIHPLRPEYDVVVLCAYGGNFGNCWRISQFPEDVDRFALTVRVYDEWGNALAEKSCIVELVEKAIHPPAFRLLCIGDSMTHRHHYVDHLAMKLANVHTVGTRTFNGGTVRHEGRGGWQLTDYIGRHADWWGGPSPFVFPEGCSGREYYGDRAFRQRLKTPDADSYALDGYEWTEIGEGQVFHADEKLWRHTPQGDVLENPAPQWAFSFEKYMDRFGIEKPQAVSILLGANDLQNTDYEAATARIRQFMEELEIVVASIHAYDPKLDVIVCLPVCGAMQHAWGMLGNSSGKRYRLNGMKLCRALLDRWENREEEHVHVCPMRLYVDPEYGFEWQAEHPMPYSDQLAAYQSNWVHPNAAGYRQMGDALACTIEKVRNEA